jgi:hypothetical protein
VATKYWISTSSTSFNTAANWSDAAAPANSDTLIFNGLGTANVETNLGTTLTGLTIIVEQSYAGQIGVLSGSTATYLKIDGGTLVIGQNTGHGAPSGSALIMVDFGASNSTNAGTVRIYDSSSSSASDYYPPILITNTSTNGTPPVVTVQQYGGSAGFSALPGDTAGARKFSYYSSPPASGAPAVAVNAYFGSGATTNLIKSSVGTLLSRSAITAPEVTLSGNAKMVYEGSGDLTALNVYEQAEFEDRGTEANITALKVGGTYRRRSNTAVSCPSATFTAGATFDVDSGNTSCFSFTSTKTLSNCSIQDVNIIGPVGEWVGE